MKGRAEERSSDRARSRGRRMEQAQAGDEEAYRLLLEDVGRELRGYFRRRVRDGHVVEDLVQETLLTLHRARHSYDPARPFEPWLYTIARNTAASAFRRDRERARFERLAEDASPLDDAAGDAGRAPSLEGVLAVIPDTQRTALEMVKIEGVSIEAAALRAGVSPGAMRVRVHRGYRALRALLLDVDG